MPRPRDVAFSLLPLLFATISVAQQDPCLTRTVPVNVMTSDGNLVWGLHASDFKAQLGRQPAEIVSVTADAGQHRAVIVLDASGSMADKWGASLALAEGLLKWTPHTAFALITFSDQIRERVGFDKGNDAVRTKLADLEKFTPGGHTGLLDALHEALVTLNAPQIGDAIYLISDGGDNRSRLTESEIKKELRPRPPRVFGFAPMGPVAARGRTPLEVEGPGFLRALTKESGGDLILYAGQLHVSTTRDVNVPLPPKNFLGGVVTFAARAFGQEISEFYRLEIKLPAPLEKPRSWKLEVSAPKGTKGRPFIVIYPEQLMPCEPRGDQEAGEPGAEPSL